MWVLGVKNEIGVGKILGRCFLIMGKMFLDYGEDLRCLVATAISIHLLRHVVPFVSHKTLSIWWTLINRSKCKFGNLVKAEVFFDIVMPLFTFADLICTMGL